MNYQAPRQTLTAPIRRKRFAYVALFFCFWVIALASRLTWLQVYQHKIWVDRATRQQQAGVRGSAAAWCAV